MQKQGYTKRDNYLFTYAAHETSNENVEIVKGGLFFLSFCHDK